VLGSDAAGEALAELHENGAVEILLQPHGSADAQPVAGPKEYDSRVHRVRGLERGLEQSAQKLVEVVGPQRGLGDPIERLEYTFPRSWVANGRPLHRLVDREVQPLRFVGVEGSTDLSLPEVENAVPKDAVLPYDFPQIEATREPVDRVRSGLLGERDAFIRT